jgi:HK97 family phage major capsid protein
LGRPILVLEQCCALGDLGDIAFCDFGRYVLADKGAMQTASSLHVRFLYGEQVLRFTYRVDGQPELDSAITPAHGTDTISPFVLLEARG